MEVLMPPKHSTLHGNAPDKAAAVLLLIDVINDFDFEGAEALLAQAIPVADRIADLCGRAREAKIPIIYVNDNFGRWQSDQKKLLEHALSPDTPGHVVVQKLQPAETDYFVLKAKHSGFFSTILELLLVHLCAEKIILVGFAGNICVLFTANDAYMRDYALFIPSDCVASNTPEENDYALEQMRVILKADIIPSTELDLEAINVRTGSP
jgi:nicotinamidase-related amidase